MFTNIYKLEDFITCHWHYRNSLSDLLENSRTSSVDCECFLIWLVTMNIALWNILAQGHPSNMNETWLLNVSFYIVNLHCAY